MLGYVRAVPSELRVREYECYRALYCGLCKSMGKCTGQCSRMTLSYDFVFLAAVRMALLSEVPKIKKVRCVAHWLRPRKAALDSPTLAYCADASALLTYQKLLDDCTDERGVKKLRALMLRPFLYRAYRNAEKRYPTLNKIIAETLDELHTYEQNTNLPPSADTPAQFFGKLMEAVFSEELEGSDARIAGTIGRVVGHWIYLVDAADDFEGDRKKQRFNPYLGLFGENLSEEEKDTIRVSLTVLLTDAERAFLLMDNYPIPELREILANILYLGLPQAADKVLCNSCQSKKEKKI